jgi:hypothetical protein
MLNTQTILRDSAIVLGLMLVGAGIYGGWDGLQTPALAVLSGGLLGGVNLFLIARVVARLTAAATSESSPSAGPVLAGLLAKTVITAALLFAMFQFLNGIWIMVGLGAIVLSLSVRSIAQLFAAPDTAQEA